MIPAWDSAMPWIVPVALILTVLAPLIAVMGIGVRVLLGRTTPREALVAGVMQAALIISILATGVIAGAYLGLVGPPIRGDIDFGAWLELRDFRIPALLRLDQVSVTIAAFAAILTSLVARFSRTYLHREPGFVRFFVLLGVFATGTQLVALAGALELFFAGWELIGIASAFFIGFFHERDEPVRSSLRAFATYRFSDAGLLIGTVACFELLGSTRFSSLSGAQAVAPAAATGIALLFLLSAMGKSAQLPFSGWLPRAMEGPTPSSALFYGAVSIHAGVFLLLRIWPLLAVSLVARSLAVVVGLATAVYASLVVRVHADAKGALAHATLAQVGLIFAEIGMGWTDLALTHLVCHAFLRLGQYLKAPNMIHDAHRLGLHGSTPGWMVRHLPRLADRMYAAALHRLRLDDLIDALIAPLLAVARGTARIERAICRHPASSADSSSADSSSVGRAGDGSFIASATIGWAFVIGSGLAVLSSDQRGMGFGAVALCSLVQAGAVWRRSRTGAAMLGLSALAVSAAAILPIRDDGGSSVAIALCSVLAILIRAGVFPLHAGVTALCDRAPAVQRQQLAGLVVLVIAHLRFTHDGGALAPILVRFGAGSCLIAAILTLAQRELRGFLRGTTMMHGGMLVAAIGTASLGNISAAVLVAVTFALALGGIGMMIEAVEQRTGPVRFDGTVGRASAFPVLAASFVLFGGAGVGLPGMAGFVADDLLLHTLWMESPGSTVAVILGSAFLAVATLMAFARTFLGARVRFPVGDLSGRERVAVGLMVGALLMLGVVPGLVLTPAEALVMGSP